MRSRLEQPEPFSIKSYLINFVNSLPPQTGEIIKKELDYMAGLETEWENPDQFLIDKAKDLTYYDTMLLDDTIRSTTGLKKRLTLAVPGDIKPASDEDQDKEIADAVRDMLFNMQNITWRDVMFNILDAMNYGFKTAEKVWDVVNGLVSLIKLKFKHSEFFDYNYDDFGNLNKVWISRRYGGNQPQEIIEGEDINQKLLITTYPYLKDGNIYGESDLMGAYLQWNAKFYIARWRNVYLQNYGQPIPVVKYDKETVDSGEKTEMQNTLKNLQDTMFIMIPSVRDKKTGELRGKFEIDFREVGGKDGSAKFEEAIDQLDKQIKRLLLVPDRLGFTNDGTGSFAQSKQIFDILKIVIQDLHNIIEQTVNPMIKQIVDFNWNVDKYPEWKFADISQELEKELLKILIDSKVIDRREKWIRSILGLPTLSEKEAEEIEKAKEEDIEKNQALFPPKPEDGNPVQPPQPGQPQPPQPKPEEKPKEKKFKAGDIPIDFKSIETMYDTAEDEFVKRYNAIHKKQSDRLVKQVENKKIVESKDIGKLKTLKIQKAGFKELYGNYYFKLYLNGKKDGITEIDDRLKDSKEIQELKNDKYFQTPFDIDEKWMDMDFIKKFLKDFGKLGVLTSDDRKFFKNIKDKVFIDVGEIEERMVKITNQTVEQGIRAGESTATVTAKISQFLADDRKKHALTIARTNASTFYNSGRINFFQSKPVDPFMEAYLYSAIIDTSTTAFCTQHNDQWIRKSDPQFETMNPPNHFNCRSVFVPILVGEAEMEGNFFEDYQDNFKNWGVGASAENRLPAKGFGGV
jgi:SPP1 gp7 family putative phage head morphogenesis protein